MTHNKIKKESRPLVKAAGSIFLYTAWVGPHWLERKWLSAMIGAMVAVVWKFFSPKMRILPKKYVILHRERDIEA